MLNYKIIAVIKKELREKLFSKSFILMTVLIPLLMFGILGLQTFLMTYSEDKVNLIILSEDPVISYELQKEFPKAEVIKNKLYSIRFDVKKKGEVEAFVNKNKKDLLDGKITGILFIPGSVLENKNVEYYSKAPNSNKVFNKIKEPLNKVLLEKYFEGKDITPKDLVFAKQDVNFNEFKISSQAKIEEAGQGNTVIAFLFTFLLYFSLLMIGSMMMSSVIQEKANRVVEVLLSSLESTDLLTGKVLGAAITGVMQMFVWLTPLILLISTTWFVLPQEFLIKLDMLQILYFLINFLIALITFLGLFAAVGSIFENPQDSQQGAWPVMILIMIPFFVALGMMDNAENSIAVVTSMVPFGSLIVMPARMTIVEVPLWQFILSFSVNIATMLLIFIAAGKIYRVGILSTGKKPKFTEVIKWLKYSS